MILAHITDIHYHPTQPSYHTDRTHALKKVIDTLPLIQKHAPDLYILGGDFISAHPEDFETKLDHFYEILEPFVPVKQDCIFLLGNHEEKVFSIEQIQTTLSSLGFNTQLSGVKDFDEYRVIWVESHEFNQNDQRTGIILHEALTFLENSINSSSLPVVVVFHHSPIPTPQKGNIYFEKYGFLEYRHRVSNHEEVVKLLSNPKVSLVINGHTHWLTLNFLNQVPYFGGPSFSEHLNSANTGSHEGNPGVYSIIEISDTKKCVTVYAGEFAYASLSFEK